MAVIDKREEEDENKRNNSEWPKIK